MPFAPSRPALPCLALLAFLAAPFAVQASPPEEIQQAIAASKLRYEVGGPGPVKQPVEELHCPARSTDTRVVREADGGKRLAPWKPSPEAAPHFAEAEKLFAAQSYAAAGEAYQKGLALDPSYGPGWLYAGDIPFAQRDFPAALPRYRKA